MRLGFVHQMHDRLVYVCLLGTGFWTASPGIVPHLFTLSSNFRVPFYREIILAMGTRCVKNSCSKILKGRPSRS